MSGSTPCPLCGTLTGPGDEHCQACGLSLREVRDTNAGGAKCARCGSAMPSGFDFCPVCGQDQRERWRRPPTQQLRIHPAPRSQDFSPPRPQAVGPGGHPGMATPFGALVEAPPGPGPGMHRGGPDRTVPTPHFGSPGAPQFGSPDRTVPSPAMMNAPEASRLSMPPIESQPAPDDDVTLPEGSRKPGLSFEEVAFGQAGAALADSGDDSKTIPFISLRQRQERDDGPKLTIPALFTDNPPPAKAAMDRTKPDRPGGFSGGPTGEAPPTGVNVAQRSPSHAPISDAQSRHPTYPGAQSARLVLVARDGTEGESFPFVGDTITVGRTHGDILFPEDPFLSPVHVRLTRTGNGILLTDAGSTNGVYMRIGKVAPVYPGDMFMIGHQLLRLDQLDSQAQEHPPGVDGTRLFGTPLQPAWGRVTQLGRGGVTGDHMYLRGSRVSFGREGGDLVFPNDPFVSREHARLRLEINGQAMAVFLEDLGSANGSYVRIRGAAEISRGDAFRVGDQILKLRLD